MTQEFLKAFIMIFIAEMGDKTQILAMAFATRYPVRKVLLGIGVGVFFNHGIAVLLGSYLSEFIPIQTLQLIAGIAFVFFALWTLKVEEEEEEENKKQKKAHGAVVTIALAFFLGELGDKTQLTAIALSADSIYPYMILAGTVSGMIATGSLGIFVGRKLGDRIPEFWIKMLASSIFMVFGLQKLFVTVPSDFLKPLYMIPALMLLGVVTAIMLWLQIKNRKEGLHSAFLENARILHEGLTHIENDLNHICLGSDYCGNCQGASCPIGMAKKIATRAEQYRKSYENAELQNGANQKPFQASDVMDCLVDSLCLIEQIQNPKQVESLQLIRKQFEQILFDTSIPNYRKMIPYVKELDEINSEYASRIRHMYQMRNPVEKRIIQIGKGMVHNYLLEMSNGYLLIDTGYAGQYRNFLDTLKKNNIQLSEITYIFITHAHEDHVGYLKKLMEETDAIIVLHPKALEQLEVGINARADIFTSKIAKIYGRFQKKWKHQSNDFDVVDDRARLLLSDSAQARELEKKWNGKILELPGHTIDSIGLIVENQVLFCGDAVTNWALGYAHIMILMDQPQQYLESWKKMLDSEFDLVYPSHGNPFSKNELPTYQMVENNLRQFM